MVDQIIYEGKIMGKINNDRSITFNGPDLNPLINSAVFDIVEVEDDMGNIVFERSEAGIVKKIVFLESLGFEIKIGGNK